VPSEVRGLNPHGSFRGDIRRRTLELDDYAKVAPTNGQIAVWTATGSRGLWTPRALVSTDVPNVPLTAADATARGALTGLTDGQLVFQLDVELLYQWDADAGGSWRGVRSAGMANTAAAISDINITSSGTMLDWGSAVTITNPGVPVDIVAHLDGYLADFTAIAILNARVGISIDGGSSYTFCSVSRDVAGQGGAHYNSATIARTHFRTGVTPTGNVLAKAQAQSNLTTSTAADGILSVTMTPV